MLINLSIAIGRDANYNINKYTQQSQSLTIIKKTVAKRKQETQMSHENNLVANGYLNQHENFVEQVLSENTRNPKLYLQWKNVACIKECSLTSAWPDTKVLVLKYFAPKVARYFIIFT